MWQHISSHSIAFKRVNKIKKINILPRKKKLYSSIERNVYKYFAGKGGKTWTFFRLTVVVENKNKKKFMTIPLNKSEANET